MNPTAIQQRAASAEIRHDHEVMLASRRGRLMASFVELAAERGYDAVTIIEIVTHAGTSKRAFYEYFTDKQDCLIQAYEVGSSMLVNVVLAEAHAVEDPTERIRAGLRAYLSALADQPDFTRLFLSESLSAGDRLTERWIQSMETVADVVAEWRVQSSEQYPEMPELSPLHALTVISGINAVIAIILHRDGFEAISERSDELTELAARLLTAGG